MISECDNIQLNAILLTQCLFPIVFKWNISYASVNSALSTSIQQEAENYFMSFTNFSSTTSVSIPPKYYTNNCTLNVILIAQTSGGQGTTSTSTQVKIGSQTPTVKFTGKTQNFQSITSTIPSIIPFIIANKKCTNPTLRLLDGNSIIPITLDFKLYSGFAIPPTSRGDSEMQIEKIISSIYNNYQSVSLNFSQGFKYNLYYNLIATVTDANTNTQTSDSLIFTFIKPDITCIIDPIGSIVSITKDLYINGGNSIIPESDGDSIQYLWKCLSSISYSNGVTCVCPVLTAYNLQSKQIVISASKLQNLCDYTFSLTVISTSNNGNRRTSTDQIEFLAFKSIILPVYGKTIDGYLPNIMDIYFTSQLTSTCSDSMLTYEWSLIEVESLVPLSPEKYSQMNTFIYNFLSRINITSNSSMKIGDLIIPDRYIPNYLTAKNVRTMGLDVKSMVENTRYVFAVVVNYPVIPSYLFNSFDAPPKPRQRIFTIMPMNGIGMTTSFSLMFSLPVTTDVDQAQYQILRRDCPSTNSQASPVTQLLDTINSYTGVFSPGLQSCNFQVEIILLAVEYDSAIQMSNIITITNPQISATDLVASCLNDLLSNNNYTTPNQKISALSEISNIRVTEPSKSGKDSVNTIIDIITQLDAPTGGIIDLMDELQIPYLLNATASTLGKVLTTQAVNVDPSTALNVSSKMSDYFAEVQNISGGTKIIPTCVNTLSSVADIGNFTKSDNSFFNQVQQVINQVPDLKLGEVVAGAPPYSLSTPEIELVINNNYLASFNSSQNTTTVKGSQMQLPANLTNTILNEIPNYTNIDNNTMTIGITLNGVSFDPYTEIKTNAIIDINSIANTSTVQPNIIAQIYQDLAAGKLQNVVDTKKQNSDILQAIFTPLVIYKNGDSQNSNTTFLIGQLGPDKNVNWTFPINGNPNNSISTPLYYLPDNNWTNEGCTAIYANFTDKVKASCNNLGNEQQTPTKKVDKVSFKIVMDLIESVYDVLKAGNYEMLYNFNAFNTATWQGYFVIVSVILFLGFIGYLAWFLNKNDPLPLFEERIYTLYERYGTDKEEDADGIMKKVYVFYSEVRRKGMSNVIKSNQPSKDVETNQKNPQKEEYKFPNGFNVLTEQEEKDLRDTYYFYAEHDKLFSNKYFFNKYATELCSDPILRRLTQARIADELISKPPTFWRILKVLIIFYILYRGIIYI